MVWAVVLKIGAVHAHKILRRKHRFFLSQWLPARAGVAADYFVSLAIQRCVTPELRSLPPSFLTIVDGRVENPVAATRGTLPNISAVLSRFFEEGPG
jgi:hypothetical protein